MTSRRRVPAADPIDPGTSTCRSADGANTGALLANPWPARPSGVRSYVEQLAITWALTPDMPNELHPPTARVRWCSAVTAGPACRGTNPRRSANNSLFSATRFWNGATRRWDPLAMAARTLVSPAAPSVWPTAALGALRWKLCDVGSDVNRLRISIGSPSTVPVPCKPTPSREGRWARRRASWTTAVCAGPLGAVSADRLPAVEHADPDTIASDVSISCSNTSRSSIDTKASPRP